MGKDSLRPGPSLVGGIRNRIAVVMPEVGTNGSGARVATIPAIDMLGGNGAAAAT